MGIGIRRALKARLIPLKRRLLGQDLRWVFRDIYLRNRWRGAESVSGLGSSMDETAAIRDSLPCLLKQLGVNSVLDAPCGDFHWMRGVDLGVERYIGMDIVPDLIEANKRDFGYPGRHFIVGDITRDPLPKVDLILCRDCLVAGFRGGEEFEQETLFSEYKEMAGIKRATKMVAKRDGEKFMEQTITEFKILDKVDPKTFTDA